MLKDPEDEKHNNLTGIQVKCGHKVFMFIYIWGNFKGYSHVKNRFSKKL